MAPGMTRPAAAGRIRADPQAADTVFRDLMSASTGTRRAVQNGMFTFACPSPAASPELLGEIPGPGLPALQTGFQPLEGK